MQHCAQADDAKVLAADADARLGHRFDAHGRYAESDWILHCAVFVSPRIR